MTGHGFLEVPYSWLKGHFPHLTVEERLKYLATILNEHFDDYQTDTDGEIRDGGYVIKRFFPKKR